MDVLAKIRAACDSDALSYDVHAAVAELIEISAQIAAYNGASSGLTPYHVPLVKWERWRAALANVGSVV
ncbi:hypothetical protein ABIE04_000136 [Rhodanobacter soli]|uniref:Uncharacterized protein n=1 Tax=Rhodanobacter soli TaxID=590609 RepID=A0ABV2PS06_9GAMM